ncbi:MAG TPA: thiamine pyrophosphate-requiring protein [Acidimicrobiales bacterium]|nr:thiamine pyrophosphate-requiring protein [Acidimicrobiales bacterium]
MDEHKGAGAAGLHPDEGRAEPGTARLSTVAEQLLVTLGAYGVERIFLNPGTDTAPLQEAVLRLGQRGLEVPSVVLCPHETVAMAAAHGYWKVTRRPQCVMVHVDVGTQNLGAMLHDAFRDRAGVLVIAGKAPYSIDPDVAGSRDGPIHWQQDVPDQAGIVRSYAKWAVELSRPDMVERTIGRALQIAASAPAGPTYVSVARDVLMEAPAGPGGAPSRHFRPAAPAALSPEALAEVATLLAGAARPLVVTAGSGRNPAAAEELRKLVELTGASAVGTSGTSQAICLSWSHPSWERSGAVAAELVAQADVLLVVESDVPWIPSRVQPAADAQIVHLDPDPIHADMPMWSFTADLVLQADTAVALRQLHDELAHRAAADSGLAERWHARSNWPSAACPAPPAGTAAGRDEDAAPTAADVVLALNELLVEDDLVVEEAITNSAPVHELLERTLPGTFFMPGGPGLGWALGGAIGVKLAQPAARVVAIVGDGTFLFAAPTAALLAASEAGANFVAIVLNNAGYNAAAQPVLRLFPDGSSAQAGQVVGTRFARPVHFAMLGEACHAHGETVHKRSELADALARAFAAEAEGRSAVVDVLLT